MTDHDDTSPAARAQFLDRLRGPEPEHQDQGFIGALCRADDTTARLQDELKTAADELSYAIAQCDPGAVGVGFDDVIENIEATAATRTQSPAERHRLTVLWNAQGEWSRCRAAYDAAARHRDQLLRQYDELMAEMQQAPGRTGGVMDVAGVDFGEQHIDRPTRWR